ncbi:response regulator [Nocardia sp. SYP-A9097]|uniref:response regulator n=1 Tax=Nocardia sp. SYP-A9097 TaxID=2663237 RepID=UPI0013278C64|nr:response regulator [Nocardia sp. SYP-A9097]MRH90049.1 response regulator [Nocardia sp. SYP-A9097]
MGRAEVNVLVVDDDFRVANMHAGIVSALPGFTVGAVANTMAAARAEIEQGGFDQALVDVYLPDGSGVDLVREIRFDAMMLTAATESETVRAALSAGALGYLVKPFDHAALASRLAGYARYRRILSAPEVAAAEVDAGLLALRPGASTNSAAAQSAVAASPTKDLVLQAVRGATGPMSAAQVAAAIGISRATAQRYPAALVGTGGVRMQLRYGSTGRPEQEYFAGPVR